MKKASLIITLRKSIKRRQKKFNSLVKTPVFAKRYLIVSLGALFVSVLAWSILGAKLQNSNADQLVDVYLFQHFSTFQNATFSSAHSFLVKWPIFFVVSLFGASAVSIAFFTVLTTLITVAALVFILYKIDRRPLVLGTICLALASCLLLVPAQPYPGGLLPVNMAMLATRNLEYVLYIASLVALIKSSRLKSRYFGLAVIFLSLLIASDKLFLSLSLGGAILALIFYTLRRQTQQLRLSKYWLALSLVSGLVGLIILRLLNLVTHISGQTGGSPYALSLSPHNLALGLIYGVMGLFTNFGANPAYSSTVLRNIPHGILSGLNGAGVLSYLINAAILVGAGFCAYKLLRHGPKLFSRRKDPKLDGPAKLSLMLFWTTAAAFAAFVISNHYYAVDARYLTIGVFAGFVCLATYVRTKNKYKPHNIALLGLVLIISVLAGMIACVNNYRADNNALAQLNNRDQTIAQVLNHHSIEALVGDYWRVMPIKLAADNKLNVSPLANCTQPRDILSSTAWQPNLKTHSFAYLISYDLKLTDYPSCKLNQVISAYGRPSSTALIAGTLSRPAEQLLFYNHGINKSQTKKSIGITTPKVLTTNPSLPVSVDRLRNFRCQEPTIMNIVAHQDDDLLFMNPDLINSIKAGNCVDTIYVTAGDGGNDKFYWLSREQGSEAAYSKMLGSSDTWVERTVQITGKEYVTVAHPMGMFTVSLIFMHLPDGNLQGQGFLASHFESLSKLETGRISVINSVDGQSSYSSTDLTSALAALIDAYQPSEIRTQAHYVSRQFPDHSDHMAVGRYATLADASYNPGLPIPIKYYIGYPIHGMAPNISGEVLQEKEEAFLAYASFDGAVCHASTQCLQNPAYGAYLTREYQEPN